MKPNSYPIIERLLLAAMVLLLLPLLVLFPSPGSAQCFKGNEAFGPGERLTYEIAYTIGPAWTTVALVSLETSSEMLNGKAVWHLKASGKTDPTYEFLYKVNDYFEAWIDPTTFRPAKFSRNTYHDGVRYLFNWLYYPNQNLGVWTSRTNDEPVLRGTFKTGACDHDMVTSVYYPRTLPLEQYKPGTKVPISVIYSDYSSSLTMIADGKGVAEVRDGTKYNAYKFRIRMPGKITMFKENSEVIVWFTADANKIPVYIEAELKFGTIRVYLKRAEGMRNPMTAKID